MLHVASKRSFLLTTVSQITLLALRLLKMVGYLQENTEWPMDLLDSYGSKVHVSFKSSPIFLNVSCCFFILMKEVENQWHIQGDAQGFNKPVGLSVCLWWCSTCLWHSNNLIKNLALLRIHALSDIQLLSFCYTLHTY